MFTVLLEMPSWVSWIVTERSAGIAMGTKSGNQTDHIYPLDHLKFVVDQVESKYDVRGGTGLVVFWKRQIQVSQQMRKLVNN